MNRAEPTAPAPDYVGLKQALAGVIPADRLIDDPLRTLTYGTDASFYRLIPRLVVKVVDEAEVVELLRLARRFRTPVTFRAAGTSLSGQAITDAVLAVLDGTAWRACRVLDDGARIRLQPGIVGASANARLAPYERKIGPDPASIATAKIGGIAANNASGMCCGVAQNSYQTLDSVRLVFADGSRLDTGDPASRAAFLASHPDLVARLDELAARTRADPELAERIRAKFRIKNTTGYSLNALVDYQDPIDVIAHLMIGSEGTLGFISEITYRTVHDHPCKASALVFFPDVAAACRAVSLLKSQPVDAVEIMDRAALHSVQDQPGMPASLRELGTDAAALLIETRAADQTALARQVDAIVQLLAGIEVIGEVAFTAVPAEFEALWKIRKGLFPSVGAVRAAGTAVVIEDVAFPVPRLAEATLELQELFARHGYANAIIFGHALEGNLHFVITPDFGDPAEIERYRGFMDELCHLVVVRFDGSLKAEHSTGRNIAPYVELEWGREAYRLMREIKALFDPAGLLNPGVILNDDPQIHIKDFKPMPAVDPRVDRCIECGFCEPICPSRDLSLTPRQRIVALREQARLVASGEDPERLAVIEQAFAWAGNATCAADGLCATRCPVGIDTGAMVKQLRAAAVSDRVARVGGWFDEHMAGVTRATRLGLAAAHGLGAIPGPLEALTGGIRKLSGDRIPVWDRWTPRAAGAIVPPRLDGAAVTRVVYFPSCVSRAMGTASADSERRDLHEVVLSLLAKARIEAVLPDRVDGLCCGMPFASKGITDPAEQALRRTEAALWEASEHGRLTVLCDTSPCTARLIEGLRRPLHVLEPIRFIREHVIDRLRQVDRVPSVAVHVTCSARKLGLADDLLALAGACAERVVVPEEEGCCGFAGDRGFTVPELNASALARLKAQLPDDCAEGVSNSRTCEIGLSRHSGIPYRSIVYLVDRCFDGGGDAGAASGS